MKKLKSSLSLIATFVVIVIAAVVGYYFTSLNKGPYAASDLNSIVYKWGVGDTLMNVYDSSTGKYQYVDSRDSLVISKIKFKATDYIFVHSKANEAQLWKLPTLIANKGSNLHSPKVLRYEITLNYVQKSKTVVFCTDYNGDLTIAQSFMKIQSAIEQVLKEHEE